MAFNIIMHPDVTDPQLTDLLTSFIQHFKTTTGVKLTLLESLCSGNDSLKKNPQFLLSKFSTKYYQNVWQADPNSVIIDLEHLITINRFYIRIYQYLDFRLGPILQIGDGLFSKDVESFQKELQRIVKNVQSNDKANSNLGDLFLSINAAQNSFVWGMLEKIQKKKVTIPKVIIDQEVVDQIKKFLGDKINKQQNQGLREVKVKQHEKSIRRQHRLSLPVKTEETSPLKTWMIKKIPAKKDAVLAVSSFNMEVKLQGERIQWSERLESNYSEESVELQDYVAQKQKDRLQDIYGLMDLDNSVFLHHQKEKGQILAQIQHRNIKIKLYMETFISKYQRKLRKREKKDRNDRSTQSSAKTSKAITQKSQETSLYEPKVDSMQNMNPFFKNISQNLRRGNGGLQLPPIVNYHSRRITLQK